MKPRNYDIEELRRLDVAHHLAPQQDQGLMQRLGGATIITRAEGCTIYDGHGAGLLDGMAGLWCVMVGYGREELAKVRRGATRQNSADETGGFRDRDDGQHLPWDVLRQPINENDRRTLERELKRLLPDGPAHAVIAAAVTIALPPVWLNTLI